MEQKKFYLIGSLLILSGTILLGFMHLTIAIYIPNMGGYVTPPGLIVTVLNQISGWFPYVLSIVQIVLGTILVLKHLLKK